MKRGCLKWIKKHRISYATHEFIMVVCFVKFSQWNLVTTRSCCYRWWHFSAFQINLRTISNTQWDNLYWQISENDCADLTVADMTFRGLEKRRPDVRNEFPLKATSSLAVPSWSFPWTGRHKDRGRQEERRPVTFQLVHLDSRLSWGRVLGMPLSDVISCRWARRSPQTTTLQGVAVNWIFSFRIKVEGWKVILGLMSVVGGGGSSWHFGW